MSILIWCRLCLLFFSHKAGFKASTVINSLKLLASLARVIKAYTGMKMIQAKIADVDDLQARRISAAENLLRQDLTAIEAIIEIIDVEMGSDPWYLTVGKKPLERGHKLLSKLDSIRRSKERGSVILKADKGLSNKFIGQVE